MRGGGGLEELLIGKTETRKYMDTQGSIPRELLGVVPSEIAKQIINILPY